MTLLIYVFVWIGLCYFVAYLYRIKSKLFKEDMETAKSKLRAVYIASMAGAIIGFMLCLFIVTPLLLIISSLISNIEILKPFINWITEDEMFEWIDFKISALVIYMSCVFVSGMMWLLGQDKIIIKKEEDWKT